MDTLDKLKKDGNDAYKKGSFKKAIEYYDKALVIKKNDSELWYAKALCLYQIGKYKEAVDCHNIALKLNPLIQREFRI